MEHNDRPIERMAALEQANERLRRELEVRRRVEHVLLASQVRFEALLEAAPDGILIVDEAGRILLVNARLEAMFGYKRDALLGQTVEMLLPQARRDAHARQRAEYALSPRMRPMGLGRELVARHKDGAEFPVEISLSYVKTEDGLQVIAHVMDITLRQQIEDALEAYNRSQRVLKTLLEVGLENVPLGELLGRALDIIFSIPWLAIQPQGGIFVVEDDPGVLVLKAQRNLSVPLQTTCSRVPFGRCLCGRAAASGQMQFADCVDDRHENRYEGIVPHGHYSVPILSQDRVIGVMVLFLEEGHRRDVREAEFLYTVANTLAGVIERKRAEEALQHYAAELEARNRELDAYSHTIAHDLKAPLTTVIGYASYLLDLYEDELEEDARESVAYIYDSGRRMADMIEQLLRLAVLRDATEAAVPVEVGPLVAAATARFRGSIRERGIAVEVAPDLPFVVGHAPWLEEVFANLIGNAVKYIGADNPAPHIAVRGHAQDGVVRYEVQDNGIGIPLEQQERLFEMFTRFHQEEARGLGLGLAIVHRIITRLNGQVGVESAPGEGSTFWFTLPAVE